MRFNILTSADYDSRWSCLGKTSLGLAAYSGNFRGTVVLGFAIVSSLIFRYFKILLIPLLV